MEDISCLKGFFLFKAPNKVGELVSTGAFRQAAARLSPHSQNSTENLSYCSLLLVLVDWVVLFVLLHVPPHGVPLPAQAGRHLLVHVGEQQFGVGLQAPLGPLKRLHHGFAGLLPPAALVVLAPPAAGRHVVSQSGDGVVLLVPVVHLVHRAVGRAVVAGAVVTDSDDTDQINEPSTSITPTG